MMQLPMFDFNSGQGSSRSCEAISQPSEDPLAALSQPATPVPDDNHWAEADKALDPFEVLSLDPLLTDVSPDATGILSEPAWSAIFATQNLLDHLGLGLADRTEVYEQHLYNVIWRAKLELDLLDHPERVIPFYYHTETADLRLALVIQDEFQPPAAVIGLAEDF
jgi:hypothetical protein